MKYSLPLFFLLLSSMNFTYSADIRQEHNPRGTICCVEGENTSGQTIEVTLHVYGGLPHESTSISRLFKNGEDIRVPYVASRKDEKFAAATIIIKSMSTKETAGLGCALPQGYNALQFNCDVQPGFKGTVHASPFHHGHTV